MSAKRPTPQGLLKVSKNQLSKIKPLNDRQEEVFDAWERGFNLLLDGPAGTGKTLLALLMAFNDVVDETGKDHVKIIRSAVPVRDIGFLPGNKTDKEGEFKAPYIPLVNQIFDRGDAYEVLEKGRVIEFLTTSHLRGQNFKDCVVFVDEVQNLSQAEIHTVMTRVGENVSVILCGDAFQCDLPPKETSGYPELKQIVDCMESFQTIRFTTDDIERSGFVREFYEAREYVRGGHLQAVA